MVDPVTLLIMGAIGATAAYVMIFMIDLTLQILAKWFRQFAYLVLGGNHIAISVQNKLATGQFKTVQGIFNTDSNAFVQLRGIKSDRVDPEIQKAHEYGRQEVVIWQ